MRIKHFEARNLTQYNYSGPNDLALNAQDRLANNVYYGQDQ